MIYSYDVPYDVVNKHLLVIIKKKINKEGCFAFLESYRYSIYYV